MNVLFSQILLGIVFLTIVYLHIAKKNSLAVLAYSIQSLAIVVILLYAFFDTGNESLLFTALLGLVIKVVWAPLFFFRLIQKFKLKFTLNTYLSVPLTLIILAILTAIAHSQKFAPLTDIIPANQALLSFALSSIFLSLFFIVNGKSALSQIIGILSFENAIVAFALFAGLEQEIGLQIGIIFDLFVWVIIATGFMSMIYKHFGSLDVTSMKHLKE